MMLWNHQELLEATGGKFTQEFDIQGINIDSREVKNGDLFVALRAARDGHEFVQNALAAGAAGALVSEIPSGCQNAPLLVVDDVEQALSDMGNYRRNQVDAKIVAITGSAGKTSTKEMMRTVFGAYGNTHASAKSFNNHWGVPLTLARMPRDTQFGVFEIGMNHPGEIEPLVKQVRPDVAIITNIASAHLAGFENEAGIAKEKASILRGLDPKGVGIVFGDMDYREVILNEGRDVIWFGLGDHDLHADQILVSADSSQAHISTKNGHFDLRLNVPGAHHLMNALAVIGGVQSLDLDVNSALKKLENWTPPSGRGEEITSGSLTIIDESYNANPLSMRAAIEAFSNRQGKRRLVILGDMRELGDQSASLHAALVDVPALASMDGIYTVGTEMENLSAALDNQRAPNFANAQAMVEALPEILKPGDQIMIKASLGIGLKQVVDAAILLGQSKFKL